MKVLKVINNNVLSCVDDRGRETVVMGRGLGFQARPGMEIPEKAAEKIFRMDTKEQTSKLQDLIARVPAELLQLCASIADYAGRTLGRRLNPSIYLTLTDHVQFAMERCRQNLNLHNALLTEVRVFYPEEYTIGCYALEQIASHMGVTLPDDEAASIALHLVNAEYDRTMNATMRAAQVLHPMVEILKKARGLELDTGSLRYSELLVHLKFMAMEAFTPDCGGADVPLPPEDFMTKIPQAWACAREICDYLCRESGKNLSGPEILCLAICIQRAAQPKL